MGFIGGPTGSGKSFASLSIAEMLDQEFDINRCVFTGSELMNLINSGQLKKGSVIVFEEAGIELSNRSWQSLMNKMLGFLIQTFRHKNFILIFNSPYMDFVDSATRKLFHAEINTRKIDFEKKMTILKPQIIQYNARLKKFYYKYLRIGIKNQGMAAVKSWSVPKPSAALIKAYEKKKTEFTTALNKEIQNQIMLKKEKKPKKKVECNVCGHIWQPRAQSPGRCPKCQKFDHHTHGEPAAT